MILTEQELALLQAFYDYNRIPLWIFDDQKHLIHSFFSDTSDLLTTFLCDHITNILPLPCTSAFDLLYNENELYYTFSFDREGEVYYTLGGPILLTELYAPTWARTLSFACSLRAKELKILLDILPVITPRTLHSCLQITMLILHHSAPDLAYIDQYQLSRMDSSVTHSFTKELFENREDYRLHSPYSHEVALLNCVKNGDASLLEATFKALPETKYGKMSNAPLHQLFYGCIANTTLVTRYAIEGGLDEETAFTLSDVYIKQMENCHTLYELNILNEKMALDFTNRVAKSKALKTSVLIEPIAKCMDYVSLHLHQKISLTILAEETHLTPKYLSALFHKETGQTISSYIEKKKIEEATSLLKHSKYTTSEIANHLSFHSHSYFISVFKKNTGMTPKEYRNTHWRRFPDAPY